MEKIKKVHFWEDRDERDARYFVNLYESGVELQRIRGRNLYFYEFISFIMSEKDTHRAIMKEFKMLCDKPLVRHRFEVRNGMSGCSDIYDYEYWASEWDRYTFHMAKKRTLLHISMEDKCIANKAYFDYSHLAILVYFFMCEGYLYDPHDFVKPRKFWKARRAYKYVWYDTRYGNELSNPKSVLEALMPPQKDEEDEEEY